MTNKYHWKKFPKFPHVSWGKAGGRELITTYMYVWRAETQQVLTFHIAKAISERESAFLSVHSIYPFFHCWVFLHIVGMYYLLEIRLKVFLVFGVFAVWVEDPVLCPKRPKTGLCYSLSSYVKAWVYVPQKSWTLSKQLGRRNIKRARAHLIESACATRQSSPKWCLCQEIMVWKLTSAMFWFKTSNGAVEILKVYKYSLFRNKRFSLNKMFQRNPSKFVIFYV